MDVGMLWFDSDKRQDIVGRIRRAAAYYQAKYGGAPNMCFVNPRTAESGLPGRVGNIRVEASRAVLRDHFWLGVQDKPGT